MTPEPKKCDRHPAGHRGQGPSSFWMQPPDPLFDALGIQPGQVILDIGCGAGDYTLEAARRTGETGCVTALDHWPPTVDAMEDAARAAGLFQVCAKKGDIIRPPLPVMDNTVDLCLVFTVLHIFNLNQYKEIIFSEIARVIKPGGWLAVLECKKEEWSFGLPLHMRLAPEEIVASIQEWGFTKCDYRDLGYNYLLCFTFDDG